MVRVLCNDNINKEEIIEGMEVIRLKKNFTVSNTPIRYDMFCQISRNTRNWKPDLINAHLPVIYSADIAAVVSKCYNIPFVLTYHNENVHPQPVLNSIAKLYSITIHQVTLGLSHRIIVASPFSYYESPFIKRFREKSIHIPPGVDINSYSPGKCFDLHQRYGLPHEAGIVLFVGQISSANRHKGIDTLLEAFQIVLGDRHCNYLVFIGSGDRVEFYRSYAARLGIEGNVIFTGWVSEADLIKFYQSADVVVLPSTTSQEGFGMVLIEGSACGKPVIGSCIGGIKYLIKNNEDGFTVPPKDKSYLANAIAMVLNDKCLARDMGLAGRQKATQYDWEIITDKTETVFSNAIEASQIGRIT
jgi:glycosyltransferase involved in cell wall biosynthesis